MILTIDTSDRNDITLVLHQGRILLAKKTFPAHRQQAEKLLPAIEKLLQKNKLDKTALKKIIVADAGGSFTSLRIGVVTANALAYGLDLPIETLSGQAVKTSGKLKIVAPSYDQDPTIIIKQKLL